MPYVHCSKCHHEWETSRRDFKLEEEVCDWCGQKGAILLEDETPLEKLCSTLTLHPEILDELLSKGKK